MCVYVKVPTWSPSEVKPCFCFFINLSLAQQSIYILLAQQSKEQEEEEEEEEEDLFIFNDTTEVKP